jgi:hypothetical protein
MKSSLHTNVHEISPKLHGPSGVFINTLAKRPAYIHVLYVEIMVGQTPVFYTYNPSS